MPAAKQPPGAVTTAGQGKPGYCVLCSIKDPRIQDEFDRRAALYTGTANTYSYKKLQEWLQERGLKAPSRNTIDKHRKHVRNPQDRVVTAVARRQGRLPAQTSHEEFLNTLVAIGNERIANHPDDVTIDQALKAANIQAQREKKGETHNILVTLMTQGAPDGPTIIEGEGTEV